MLNLSTKKVSQKATFIAVVFMAAQLPAPSQASDALIFSLSTGGGSGSILAPGTIPSLTFENLEGRISCLSDDQDPNKQKLEAEIRELEAEIARLRNLISNIQNELRPHFENQKNELQKKEEKLKADLYYLLNTPQPSMTQAGVAEEAERLRKEIQALNDQIKFMLDIIGDLNRDVTRHFTTIGHLEAGIENLKQQLKQYDYDKQLTCLDNPGERR